MTQSVAEHWLVLSRFLLLIKRAWNAFMILCETLEASHLTTNSAESFAVWTLLSIEHQAGSYAHAGADWLVCYERRHDVRQVPPARNPVSSACCISQNKTAKVR